MHDSYVRGRSLKPGVPRGSFQSVKCVQILGIVIRAETRHRDSYGN